MTLLVGVPLQEELDALLHALHQHGIARQDAQIGQLPATRFADLDVVIARGGHGKTQFGIQTQHLLEHSGAIEAVACCGAAGALDNALAVGDLVVATETVEHDYTLRFVSRPLPRFAGDPTLLEELQCLPRATAFQVRFGIVASGDEDIIETERGLALRQATDACAVGMGRRGRRAGLRLQRRALRRTARRHRHGEPHCVRRFQRQPWRGNDTHRHADRAVARRLSVPSRRSILAGKISYVYA